MFGSFYLVVRFFYSQEAVCTFFKVHTASACTTSVDTYHDKTFVAHVSFEHASITEASDAPSVSTCCEPGPLYWCMMTGYFLLGSKLAGFIIQPFSSTRFGCTETEKLFFGMFSVATSDFSFELSNSVVSSLPLLLFIVISVGVSILEKLLI